MRVSVQVDVGLGDVLDDDRRRTAMAEMLRSAAESIQKGDGETVGSIQVADRAAASTVIDWASPSALAAERTDAADA